MKNKKHTIIKVFGITLSVLLCISLGIGFYLTSHTQIIVNNFQKALYSDGVSPNSYEPLNSPYQGVKDNGQYLISEIKYSTEYPNSYLDIIYPDENVEAQRPTIFYFHGGGFFGGSKNMGDPLASSEATYLLDDICAKGYNIVNVDYALVPDYHFPTPLVQANLAFSCIMEHKKEYNIDMDNIVIMGSSAGAIMTSQLGSIISNPDYAQLLGISPAISTSQLKAVVVDDAPLDYENFTLSTKILIGNYVKGSIFLSDDEISHYNNILHLTKDYPPSFLLGSEYYKDMRIMHEALDEQSVENILVDPLSEHGVEKPHCFIASERVDPIAKDAFDRLITFLNEKTK